MQEPSLTEPRTSEPREPPASERSTLDLVRSISSDTVELVRKEVELARQEIVEAVNARVKAAAALAVAGVLGLFALGFLASAAAHALDQALPTWASRLIVAGVFALLLAGAFVVGRRRLS